MKKPGNKKDKNIIKNNDKKQSKNINLDNKTNKKNSLLNITKPFKSNKKEINKNQKFIIINKNEDNNKTSKFSKNKKGIKRKKKKSKFFTNNVLNTLRDSDRKLQQKQEDKKSPSKKESERYNSVELNSLIYEEALKFDKRSYTQYYISLLLTKHILIFTFFQLNDYNSQIIKIYIFFFTFTINFTTSAMFYSDNTMNKIYNDNGAFDFTYQLPQMLYSFLISSVLKKVLLLFRPL